MTLILATILFCIIWDIGIHGFWFYAEFKNRMLDNFEFIMAWLFVFLICGMLSMGVVEYSGLHANEGASLIMVLYICARGMVKLAKWFWNETFAPLYVMTAKPRRW